MPAGRVRWGLIGCGDIAEKRVARAFRECPGSSLDGVAGRRAEQAAAFAARPGAARSYADWRELLGDGDIDAVYVATPVRLHAEQATATAEAGKHVLCEKPMALDVSGCQRMLGAARSKGVRLGVAYYRHLYPVVRRLRELLASGKIGRAVLCHAQAFEPFDPAPDGPRSWLLRKADSGGGPLMDFGCHRIEVLLDLLGPVERVQGFSAKVRFPEREVEDTCVTHLGFSSGAAAVLSVSHAAQEARDSLEIFGTEGSAQVGVLNQGGLRIVTPAHTREERPPPHPNFHQPLIEDFVDAVLRGRDPAVTGEIGLEVNRVIAAAYAQADGPAGQASRESPCN